MNFKKIVLSVAFLLVNAASFANTNGLHLDWIDHSVNPKKNFFEYANGLWQKNHPIPPAYSHWGTMEILQEENLELIHALVENISKEKIENNSIQQKIRDFYLSGMDEKTINNAGINPLKSEFKKINGIQKLSNLPSITADLHLLGVDVLFNFGQMQDLKNSNKVIGVANQSGITLPDRDYYLKNDKKSKFIRQTYLSHMTKMFQFMGENTATSNKDAKIVLKIETIIAKATKAPAEIRDPNSVYHLKNINQLEKITPNFSWNLYFKNVHHPEIKKINLAVPSYFKKLNLTLKKIPLQEWQVYLRWHLLHQFAPYLSDNFVQEDFRLTSALNGTKTLLPRWRRVINSENDALGFAIGKIYVEKYFPLSSKLAAQKILNNIRQALKKDLAQLSWMNPQTRKAAIEKLDLMEERIGYPEKWRDYSKLNIIPGPYALNVMNANVFLTELELNKIGKPVNKSEWDLTPQEVNAYYDSSMNRINIPAGILKPPFFDPNAPASVNYGGIGFVMGHEMTHGFDDQGSKFDGHGNLKNWWTKDSLKKFNEIIDHISKQFSSYVIAGKHVQGDMVAGEATADLGGLTLAYKAFHNSKEYQQAQAIDGYSPDQQFFLGAAHVWASNFRPEEIQNQTLTDPHPPALFRVNGTLSDMPQFQQAFNFQQSPLRLARLKKHMIW